MKHLFVLLLAANPIATIAQEKSYDSLLDEEKIWTIKSTSPSPERWVDFIEYKLMEETSIDGIFYKKFVDTSGHTQMTGANGNGFSIKHTLVRTTMVRCIIT